MYGYSHGGCVTTRAVEQGGPITAAAVLEPLVSFASEDQSCVLAGYPASYCAPFFNWRSPQYFASMGDLGSKFPFLVMNGDEDTIAVVESACAFSSTIAAKNYYVDQPGASPPPICSATATEDCACPGSAVSQDSCIDPLISTPPGNPVFCANVGPSATHDLVVFHGADHTHDFAASYPTVEAWVQKQLNVTPGPVVAP